jgi:subtilase family serine protease
LIVSKRVAAANTVGLRSVWLVGLLVAAALAVPAAASAGSGNATAGLVKAIPDSAIPTVDRSTGVLQRASMSIEVALAPSHGAELKSLLNAVYDPHSASYHHWLGTGQFAARFAPSIAERNAVAGYLRQEGLSIERSPSPFLVRARGSSARVSAAFRTSLRTYVDRRGESYFANASAVQLPASVAGGVLGVIGLSNTVRMRPDAIPGPAVKAGEGRSPGSSSCETPYPTRLDFFSDPGAILEVGYGAGPGCSGLTPSQENSIYGAPNVGTAGQGQGVNAAVVEFSAYRESDIPVWWRTFYGSRPMPRIDNINVDGGPTHPVCPAGDTCPPDLMYNGDVEVDLDIEMQFSIAPAVQSLLVYNAPNDETGQTGLDDFAEIAAQDKADVVSISWGDCEQDVGAANLLAENTSFEQMALQGQSVFASSGDDGAFDCLGDGTSYQNSPSVDDPESQPWVTSAGGTSLTSFNPGQNEHPSYPSTETVWNPDSLCSQYDNLSYQNPDEPGLFWCDTIGASGGGTSHFWGRPSYQYGPGVDNRYSTRSNGSTQCAFAPIGTPCREVPDVSVNADEFTPVSEYCTGTASEDGSVCATIDSSPPGWFNSGGTSASSQFWGAIFADRDSYAGRRSGNANEVLYSLFNSDYGKYFHDIIGVSQSRNNDGLYPTNNGLYPTTADYDLATGIGSPIMSAVITGR